MNEMMESQIEEDEEQDSVAEITREQAFEEENPMIAKRRKWSAFVEGPAADFFTGYKMEKMTIDDGNGNKARFSRTKDDGIKVEYTSAVLL